MRVSHLNNFTLTSLNNIVLHSSNNFIFSFSELMINNFNFITNLFLVFYLIILNIVSGFEGLYLTCDINA